MKLLTTEEVAEILGMHEESVRRLCRQGKIPCKKVLGRWKVDQSDLEKWIEEQQWTKNKPCKCGSTHRAFERIIKIIMTSISNLVKRLNSYFFDSEQVETESALLFYGSTGLGIVFAFTYWIMNIIEFVH